MRTMDIALLGFGRVFRLSWNQELAETEEGFGLLMDCFDIVKSEAK